MSAGIGVGMNLVWQTSLSLDECKRRLEDVVDTRKVSCLLGSLASLVLRNAKPVLGRITNSKIRLEKRRWYKNDFAPIFYGTLVEDPQGGTRIEGHFEPRFGVSIHVFFWFIFGFVILVSIFTGIASGGKMARGDLYYWGKFIFKLLIAGYVVLRSSRWVGDNEKSFIAEFLQRTLEAVPVTSETQDVLWR